MLNLSQTEEFRQFVWTVQAYVTINRTVQAYVTINLEADT